MMGNLVVGMFVTLDGVYQAPGGPDEDRDGGFEHGGWTAPYWVDEELSKRIVEVTTSSDAILLGRRTYDIFAAYWPQADAGDPVAAHINGVPRYVASRTLTAPDWKGTTVLGAEVPAEVAELKQRHDTTAVTGSGDLVQTLLRHDLVDRFSLWTFPVVVGSGKRLFGEGTQPGAMKLADSWTSSNGVVVSTYERAGAVETGLVGA